MLFGIKAMSRFQAYVIAAEGAEPAVPGGATGTP